MEEAAAAAAAEFIEDDPFRHNAFKIINEMLELSLGRHSVLVDEILHSIFFLGVIKKPRYFPGDIMSDDGMLDALRRCYPGPFRCYSSQLPKRSPFSCVLDMMLSTPGQSALRYGGADCILGDCQQIVNSHPEASLDTQSFFLTKADCSRVILHRADRTRQEVVLVTGQQNENEIINRLQEFIHERLHGNQLVSSTICVSQRNTAEHSVRYYGVSMSTSGRDPGRIIVAASCLSNWDSYVADAVMTYYPSRERKTYFDGTIRLPEQVRCRAFSLRGGTPMAPCRSCGNLFGLTTNVEQVWAYGHCAEAESVSNLLKIDEEVRERVEKPSETCTDANRQRAIRSVRAELRRCLREVGFQWNNHVYNPQV